MSDSEIMYEALKVLKQLENPFVAHETIEGVLRKALDILSQATNRAVVAGHELFVKTVLSRLLWQDDRLEEAGNHANDALRLAKQLCDKEYLSHDLLLIGDVQLASGHFKEAAITFRELIAHAEALGNEVDQILAKVKLGKALFVLGERQEAGVLLSECLCHTRYKQLAVFNAQLLELQADLCSSDKPDEARKLYEECLTAYNTVITQLHPSHSPKFLMRDMARLNTKLNWPGTA